MSAGIPVTRTGKPDVDKALLIMKQHIDRMTGMSKDSTPLGRLGSNPTNAEIAAFCNRLAERLEAGVK